MPKGVGGFMATRGRDAKTGEFIPVSEAKRRPATTVVEKVKPRPPAPPPPKKK